MRGGIQVVLRAMESHMQLPNLQAGNSGGGGRITYDPLVQGYLLTGCDCWAAKNQART